MKTNMATNDTGATNASTLCSESSLVTFEPNWVFHESPFGRKNEVVGDESLFLMNSLSNLAKIPDLESSNSMMKQFRLIM